MWLNVLVKYLQCRRLAGTAYRIQFGNTDPILFLVVHTWDYEGGQATLRHIL